ncbi:MAG: CBS domain-containing protein [Bacteroidetes bacterium]|nr:CBS domain-containing protein [Bacteroidota bacterium]
MEGIFVGNSAGAAIGGLLQMKEKFKKDDVVVVIFHDHGTRYLGKMFNEDWMRDRGFIESKKAATAIDLIQNHKNQKLVTVKSNQSVDEAYQLMKKFDISQIPVVDDAGEFVGSLNDSDLFETLVEHPELKTAGIEKVMQKPFPMVKPDTEIQQVSKLINKSNQAVLMTDLGGNVHIITKYDVIDAVNA